MVDSPEIVDPGQPWAKAGSAPVPDPTRLTDQALDKLEKQVKELYDSKLEDISKLYDSKLSAMQELFNQQFKSAEEQRKEQKADTKTAVDAALQAQKEAVREQTAASDRAITKSEGGMIEQLKQLGQTVDTKVTGLTTAHNDLKLRVERMDSETRGQGLQRTEQRAITGAQVALIGLAVAIIVALITVAVFVAPNPPG